MEFCSEALVDRLRSLLCIGVIAICRFDFRLAVAVDTPAHRQFRVLVHHIHFFHRTMAGLAGYLAGCHVLSVVEVGEIRQIVQANPFYGLLLVVLDVGAVLRVPTDGRVKF